MGRFNERFMLTLGDCKSCLVCDDELNVLPLSSHARDIVPLPPVDGKPSFFLCLSIPKNACVPFESTPRRRARVAAATAARV